MTDATQGWRGIESAPRDGTLIDLWIGGEYPRRWPDCYWGYPEHCCGEAGQHCDSDWHRLKPGWVDSRFNEPIGSIEEDPPTHYQPLPPPPRPDRVAVATSRIPPD